MKKSTKILLCLSAIFVALGTVLTAGSLVFDMDPVYAFRSGMLDFTIRQKRTSEFSSDGRYVIPADGMTQLSVDWLDGEIEVEMYEGPEIILEETSSFVLDESNALMYTKKNDTLAITSAPSEYGISISGICQGSKELHIYLPQNIEWNKVQIDAQNSDISIGGLISSNLKADTVDGDLSLSEVELENLSFNSMGGNLIAKNSHVEKMNVDTTSGDMSMDLRICPQLIQFDTIDGDTQLYLPDDSEFTIQMDTVSGNLNSDFSGTHKDECFTVGSGAAQFDMNTASGSVQVHKTETKK